MSLPFSTTYTTFENIGPFFEDTVPNKGEGNCFFHAVGKCIPGEYSTNELRQEVGSYLRTLSSCVTHHDEEEWKKKVLTITQDKVWVDDIWTHFAISEIFCVSLHIYQPEESDQVLIIENSTQCDRKIIPLVLSGLHYETIPAETRKSYIEEYTKKISAETRKSYIEEYTKKSSVEMWPCTNCTFENHNALIKCEMCGEKMPNLG